MQFDSRKTKPQEVSALAILETLVGVGLALFVLFTMPTYWPWIAMAAQEQ